AVARARRDQAARGRARRRRDARLRQRRLRRRGDPRAPGQARPSRRRAVAGRYADDRVAGRRRVHPHVRAGGIRIRRGVGLMTEETKERLGAHEVAAWLRRHPKFLGQFPDLALSMVVPREDGPAASLASSQLEVLREKNRELTRRLADLFANAQENERLVIRTHQLALALMHAGSAAETVKAMAAVLTEDFNGD